MNSSNKVINEQNEITEEQKRAVFKVIDNLNGSMDELITDMNLKGMGLKDDVNVEEVSFNNPIHSLRGTLANGDTFYYENNKVLEYKSVTK